MTKQHVNISKRRTRKEKIKAKRRRDKQAQLQVKTKRQDRIKKAEALTPSPVAPIAPVVLATKSSELSTPDDLSSRIHRLRQK